MSIFYQCIICEHANNSILDLHNHHTQDHNLQELSQTIINLQGFKVWNNMKPLKNERKKIDDDDNNNENMCNNISAKRGRPPGSFKWNMENINASPRKFVHDKALCELNCKPFIAWERELNKKIEINDEDFLDSVESLCYDLSKKKRRGRKKKLNIEPEDVESKNLIRYIEDVIGVKTVAKQLKIEPCEKLTASSWDRENPIDKVSVQPMQVKGDNNEIVISAETNAVIKDILPMETEKIKPNESKTGLELVEINETIDCTSPMRTEDIVINKEIASLQLVETDTTTNSVPLMQMGKEGRETLSGTNVNSNTLIQEQLCNIFSWNSIITVNSDDQEMFNHGKNSYYELMLPNIETFL